MLVKIIRTVLLEGAGRCYSTDFFPSHLRGKVGIVGVPFGKGQKKKGKEEIGLKIAPDIIRTNGFINHLECLGLDITDYGNVQYEPLCDVFQNNMHNLDHVAPCIKAVSTAVKGVLEECRKCLVLGGDHSVAAGSIYGHMSVAGPRDVAVVYVDAHADINTDITSPTGNIHGMTVALIAEELQDAWSESDIPGLEWLSPCFSLKNITYFGLRSVDPGEAKFLCDNDVSVFSMEEIDRNGLQKCLNKALSKIDPGNRKSLHLSFDIDSLDYAEAPCTLVPERGGLTLREGMVIAEALHRTGRLSVIDFVEVNPAIGNEFQRQITLDAAKNMLLAMFGHFRRGNVKPII